MRVLDELVAPPARREGAAEVCVRVAQITGYRVDHGLRALGAAGPVEEGDAGGERREAGPDCVDVEGGGGHGRDAIRPSLHSAEVSTTLTPPQERLDRGEGTGLGRPWHVIVLNDDHNTFQGVAFALSSVIPGVSYDDGMRFADTIHRTGQAIVWSGLREQAELYWEQLRERGLTMAPLEQD